MNREPRYEVALGPVGAVPVYVWVAPQLEVMVWRQRDRIRAFSSICPHMGARLTLDGDGQRLACPWHGLTMDLASCRTNHARYRRIREWPCELRDGRLLLFAEDDHG